jgi:UDP-N-acetylglucosamine 2-epimerase (non-hydrolysing)
MPEEKNRILCDSISDHLFAPTELQKKILLGEGIPLEKIHVVGNTVVDAVLQNIKIAEEKSTILNKLGLTPKKYVLFTAHRDLNVDFKEPLTKLVKIISEVKKKTGLEVVYPMHPRTAKKIKDFGLEVKDAKVIEPLGYLDFLVMQKNANLIITDSGGLQEEACTLNVPCITIRENTERPETVDVGANYIVGLDLQKTLDAIDAHSKNKNKWTNPFGNGDTSKKIVDLIWKK